MNEENMLIFEWHFEGKPTIREARMFPKDSYPALPDVVDRDFESLVIKRAKPCEIQAQPLR